MEISTRIMIRIPKKYGEGDHLIMNTDSSAVIYVTASVEAECHMISQNEKKQEE